MDAIIIEAYRERIRTKLKTMDAYHLELVERYVDGIKKEGY